MTVGTATSSLPLVFCSNHLARRRLQADHRRHPSSSSAGVKAAKRRVFEGRLDALAERRPSGTRDLRGDVAAPGTEPAFPAFFWPSGPSGHRRISRCSVGRFVVARRRHRLRRQNTTTPLRWQIEAQGRFGSGQWAVPPSTRDRDRAGRLTCRNHPTRPSPTFVFGRTGGILRHAPRRRRLHRAVLDRDSYVRPDQ